MNLLIRRDFLSSIAASAAVMSMSPQSILAASFRRGRSVTLNELSLTHFQDSLNTKFRLHLEDSSFCELDLVEVKEQEVKCGFSQGSEVYECFSLLFQGSNEPVLEQNTYTIDHADLGTFILFLVPVISINGGVQYEAVFTRPCIH